MVPQVFQLISLEPCSNITIEDKTQETAPRALNIYTNNIQKMWIVILVASSTVTSETERTFAYDLKW